MVYCRWASWVKFLLPWVNKKFFFFNFKIWKCLLIKYYFLKAEKITIDQLEDIIKSTDTKEDADGMINYDGERNKLLFRKCLFILF